MSARFHKKIGGKMPGSRATIRNPARNRFLVYLDEKTMKETLVKAEALCAERKLTSRSALIRQLIDESYAQCHKSIEQRQLARHVEV
jgi:hypothetical protein